MYEDIKEQFAQVIATTQHIEEPLDLEDLFQQWNTNKAKFINRFGGLIYEFGEVTIELTPEDKEKRVDAFVEDLRNDFFNADLADFVAANSETFFQNEVGYGCEDYPEVKPGMKLVKSFKYFEKNKKDLADLQNRASQIIQEDKVKGTLCFSVHPLDYLTLSENTYKWTTCHSLSGERRSGNLSYMLDSSTFIVYIKGEDGEICGTDWNSKKWRVLFHASDDDEMLFSGKPYPFFSMGALDTALNVYNNLMVEEQRKKAHCIFEPIKYAPWSNDWMKKIGNRSLMDAYLNYGGFPMGKRQLVQVDAYSLSYCDVLLSTDYTSPYYTMLRIGALKSPSNRKPMIVGSRVSCPCCNTHYIAHSEFMLCDDCEIEYGDDEVDGDIVFRCDICGKRAIDGYDLGYGDRMVCNTCFDDYCDYCPKCYTVYIKDEGHICELFGG